MANEWYFGDLKVTDLTGTAYYHGHKAKEIWYQGKRIWVSNPNIDTIITVKLNTVSELQYVIGGSITSYPIGGANEYEADNPIRISWGDGEEDKLSIHQSGILAQGFYKVHYFKAPGTYEIRIRVGKGCRWNFGGAASIFGTEVNTARFVRSEPYSAESQHLPNVISAYIDKTVMSLGSRLFSENPEMDKIEFEQGRELTFSFGSHVFAESGLKAFDLMAIDGVVNASEYLFGDCRELADVALNDDFNIRTSIDPATWEYYTSAPIPNCCFQNCESLKTVALPKNFVVNNQRTLQRQIGTDWLDGSGVERIVCNSSDKLLTRDGVLYSIGVSGLVLEQIPPKYPDELVIKGDVVSVVPQVVAGMNSKGAFYKSPVETLTIEPWEKNSGVNAYWIGHMPNLVNVEYGANSISEKSPYSIQFLDCPELRKIWVRKTCAKIPIITAQYTNTGRTPFAALEGKNVTIYLEESRDYYIAQLRPADQPYWERYMDDTFNIVYEQTTKPW